MNEVRAAGNYTLDSFKMSKIIEGEKQPVELSQFIVDWSLHESIMSGMTSGSARVLDSTGTFYSFPIIGEERLDITYTDWYGIQRTEKMFLYSVTELGPVKENDPAMLGFTIHFASYGHFISYTRSIRKSYEGSISDAVKSVFEEYYKVGPNGTEGTDKEIEVADTVSTYKLVVPNYLPEDTMHFFSRYAYINPESTSTFRFFENREKYYFTTLEKMVEKWDINEEGDDPVQTFHWNQFPDDTPEFQQNKMFSIISFQFANPFDTLSAMYQGAYRKEVMEVDIVSKIVQQTPYSYDIDFPAYNQKLGSKTIRQHNIIPMNTLDFISNYMTEEKRFLVVKDYPNAQEGVYPAVRPPTNYANILGPLTTTAYHHSSNKLYVAIPGRNNLFAGDVINIDIEEFHIGNPVPDKRYSGRYVIETINNHFSNEDYIQNLVLTRGGVGA